MFGQSTTGGGLFGAQAQSQPHNPMKDFEVTQPPDDSISSVRFSPKANFLVATSWDNNIRCWEIQDSGQSVPKAQQSHTGPVLGCCWHADGTKVFTASCDKTTKMWDLNSNQAIAVAQHEAPIKTCHWIQGSSYSCLMTGSWDKTLKFWDTRTPNPVLTFQLPERCYCADVDFPMAVVGTANRQVIIYQLDNQPSEFRVCLSVCLSLNQFYFYFYILYTENGITTEVSASLCFNFQRQEKSTNWLCSGIN
jgi:mRNA export factor